MTRGRRASPTPDLWALEGRRGLMGSEAVLRPWVGAAYPVSHPGGLGSAALHGQPGHLPLYSVAGFSLP